MFDEQELSMTNRRMSMDSEAAARRELVRRRSIRILGWTVALPVYVLVAVATKGVSLASAALPGSIFKMSVGQTDLKRLGNFFDERNTSFTDAYRQADPARTPIGDYSSQNSEDKFLLGYIDESIPSPKSSSIYDHLNDSI